MLNYFNYNSHITILVCSKTAVILLCKPAKLLQVQRAKTVVSYQDCSKRMQTPKSPYAKFASNLSYKLRFVLSNLLQINGKLAEKLTLSCKSTTNSFQTINGVISRYPSPPPYTRTKFSSFTEEELTKKGTRY